MIGDRDRREERQRRRADAVELCAPPGRIELVASMDVAYGRQSDEAYAAVTVLERATLEVVERIGWIGAPSAPYIPGHFAAREAGPLLEALAKLEHTPDLYIVDGHGVAHPRHFGLACRIGLELDAPTIGCAKRLLYGEVDAPREAAGSRAPIRDRDEPDQLLGVALRTQDGINPVYVSPGHLCTVEGAADLIFEMRGDYRIPEPIRAAHHLSVELRSGRTTLDELE
jgi:deoxyribonuclease V